MSESAHQDSAQVASSTLRVRAYPAALLILFLAAAFYGLPLDYIPFSSHGEAREAVVVQDMLEQRNYVLPLRNGVDIPSKPPFFHWLAVIASKVHGAADEFAVRIPSGIAAAAVLALLFLFVARERSEKEAWLAVAILGTTFEWTRSASLARVDMALAALLTVACFLFFELTEQWLARRRLGVLLMLTIALLLCFAVLTKGPASLAIAALAVVIYVLALRLGGLTVPPLARIAATVSIIGLLAVAGACWWYWEAYQVGGYRFLHFQLFRENLARLAGLEGYATGHDSPFYMSPVLYAAGFMPWGLMLPLLFFPRPRLAVRERASRALLFSAVWCGVYLLAVTFSAGKRTVYFLPTFPALALLLSARLHRPLPLKGLSPLRVLLILGAGVLGVTLLAVHAASVLQLQVGELFDQSERSAAVTAGVMRAVTQSPAASLLIFAAAALLVLGARKGRLEMREAMFGLAASMVCLIGAANCCVYPAIAAAKSPRDFATKIRSVVPADVPLFQYRDNFYASMFYLHRNLGLLKPGREVVSTSSRYVIAEHDELDELLDQAPTARELARSENFASEGRARLVLVHVPPASEAAEDQKRP